MSLKIALIGYGKMGHIIETIAVQRGHEIVARFNSANLKELNIANLQTADVAIEFTRPESARANIIKCAEAGVPVVCGTTGWTEDLEAVKRMIASKQKAALLYASNFSVGVNIFFEVNRLLARLMSHYPEYMPSITETHHLQKKDAPSGTAISLAEQILTEDTTRKRWALNDANDARALPVFAHRANEVPGTHTVLYHSSVDDIEITHRAHNRTGFATGAVLAAEFLAGREGVYTMQDVLALATDQAPNT